MMLELSYLLLRNLDAANARSAAMIDDSRANAWRALSAVACYHVTMLHRGRAFRL
jgi:hypothetical protein